MPDPKKKQLRWDWLDEAEGFLTVSLVRKAVKQLEAASNKPVTMKAGTYYSTYIIGQYADFIGFSALVDDLNDPGGVIDILKTKAVWANRLNPAVCKTADPSGHGGSTPPPPTIRRHMKFIAATGEHKVSDFGKVTHHVYDDKDSLVGRVIIREGTRVRSFMPFMCESFTAKELAEIAEKMPYKPWRR